MDDYLFAHHVNQCGIVTEDTHCLEILNYSDAFFNVCKHQPLPQSDFADFVQRKGAYAPPADLRPGVKLLSGVRLVLQTEANAPDTFSPFVISLPRDSYTLMVKSMRLPPRAIEGTSIVGPFFWCSADQDDHDPNLHIIARKSDVRRKGLTRGWEMMLSHNFGSAITTGFVKGTKSSDMKQSVHQLAECLTQISHPLLLPMIVLAHDLSSSSDKKQRDARDWLRRLENAVSLREDVDMDESYFKDGVMNLEDVNRDLVECHSQVLWKRPQAYQAIVKEFEAALERFRALLPDLPPDACNVQKKERVELDKLHRSMLSRLHFYHVKLTGTEHYVHTSLARLKIQREALYNHIAQRESRTQIQMAGEQKRLAHAAKRDSTAMKTLSLLGALFLPGTYLASVFSMDFFNFEGDGSAPKVATELWIYFAIAVPITVVIVGSWTYFDRQRERKNLLDSQDLEKNIDQMGHNIMMTMRTKTLSRASTWNRISPKPA